MSQTTSGDPGRPDSRAPRWVWIALIASLALNLLAVGAIGGALYAGRHGGYWGGHRYASNGREFMRNLPAERREELKKLFREHRESLRPYWRQVRSARKEAAAVLREEPFDKTKFEAALDKFYQSELTAREASRPMIVDLAGKLNAGERKILLRTMRHNFLRFGHRHRRGRERSKEPGKGDGAPNDAGKTAK